MSGSLFVISAPSGAGKTTILRPVLADLANISFSISHTTRQPRPGEQNGKDYYFVTKEQFTALQERGGFLEWAEVHGNFYGTSREAVTDRLAKGDDIILDIDVQGASQIREGQELPATFVFIAPPSLEELEQRLTSRNTDSPETIQLRLANAKKELREAPKYDFQVINDVLPEAVEAFKQIILDRRAENS